MANLTITVDDETLRRARIRAIERGETVNSYLAEQLRRYAGTKEARARQRRISERLVELSEELHGDSGGWTWNRDELHRF